MFAEEYAKVFANVGVTLLPDDGCSCTEIQEAEQRLGINLPRALRDFYLLAGHEKRINQFFNRILPPSKWIVDSGCLVFAEENQWVVYWGIEATADALTNATVYEGINRKASPIEWHHRYDSLAKFLLVMTISNATIGGAAAHCSMGFVADGTNGILNRDWELVGEMDSTRFYMREGMVVCLAATSAFVRRMRKEVGPWQLYAAAQSEQLLIDMQNALPGEWEEWG